MSVLLSTVALYSVVSGSKAGVILRAVVFKDTSLFLLLRTGAGVTTGAWVTFGGAVFWTAVFFTICKVRRLLEMEKAFPSASVTLAVEDKERSVVPFFSATNSRANVFFVVAVVFPVEETTRVLPEARTLLPPFTNWRYSES